MAMDLSATLTRLIAGAQQQLSAALPEGLKSRWAALPARDRQALMLLVAVIAASLFYLLLWQPVTGHVAQRQQWQQNQQQRLERAQLAAYDRLNRFGMTDLLPVDLWLGQSLPEHRLSLVQHRQGNGEGELQLRYSNSRQAQAFLLAMSRFARLSQIETDPNSRALSLRYRLDPEYAELTR